MERKTQEERSWAELRRQESGVRFPNRRRPRGLDFSKLYRLTLFVASTFLSVPTRSTQLDSSLVQNCSLENRYAVV
jgi:hypothetical protein